MQAAPEAATGRLRVGSNAGQAQEVAAKRGRRAARTPFVLLVAGLLAAGLVCLLIVNTTLAANSIVISNLQQANAARTQRVQQLEQEVTTERSPAVIQQEALKLGMRLNPGLRFIDLRARAIGRR